MNDTIQLKDFQDSFTVNTSLICLFVQIPLLLLYGGDVDTALGLGGDWVITTILYCCWATATATAYFSKLVVFFWKCNNFWVQFHAVYSVECRYFGFRFLLSETVAMFTENECLLENNMPGPVPSIRAKCQAQVKVPCQQSGQKCFTVSDRKLPRIPVSWFSRDSVYSRCTRIKFNTQLVKA